MFFDNYEWFDKKFTWVFEATKGSPIVITLISRFGTMPRSSESMQYKLKSQKDSEFLRERKLGKDYQLT